MYVGLLKGPGNSICADNVQYLSGKAEENHVLNKFIDEEYSRKLHSISQRIKAGEQSKKEMSEIGEKVHKGGGVKAKISAPNYLPHQNLVKSLLMADHKMP